MTTADRLAPGYEPEFDIDYAFGHQGELLVVNLIESLKRERVEIKRDAIAARTGNVYIEFSCFRQGKWRPSGIALGPGCAAWAFVLSEYVVVFMTTERMRELARAAWRSGKTGECVRGSHPTKGVLVRVADLIAA